MQLTEQQEEILAFISEYQRDRKIPPSTRIVQKQFAFGSQTTAARHLEAMASKGVLEQKEGDAWEVMASEIQAVFELSMIFSSEPEAGVDDNGVIRTCAS